MSADISSNKKARRDYEILDTCECGLELKGTEVKSIRAGKVNIADAFARVENGQMLLYGCDIQPWETAGEFFQHKARRPRRLLLHKREIFKLEQQVSQKGCSLVALKLYWKTARSSWPWGWAKARPTATSATTSRPAWKCGKPSGKWPASTGGKDWGCLFSSACFSGGMHHRSQHYCSTTFSGPHSTEK